MRQTMERAMARKEKVGFDPERLEALYGAMGAVDADAALERARDVLAERLAAIAVIPDGRLDLMARSGRGLVGIADEIGMSTLARVACDLSAAAGRGDVSAASAVRCRLMRVGAACLADGGAQPPCGSGARD